MQTVENHFMSSLVVIKTEDGTTNTMCLQERLGSPRAVPREGFETRKMAASLKPMCTLHATVGMSHPRYLGKALTFTH